MLKSRFLFLLFLLVVPSQAFAQQVAEKKTNRAGLRKLKSDGLRKLKSDGIKEKVSDLKETHDPNDLDAISLVIDRTLTKDGREFYRLLYNELVFSGLASDLNIEITEKPVPGLGTQINILVGNTLIFRKRIQPKHELVRSFASQGARAVQQFVIRQQMMEQQLRDEIHGSGI